MASFTERYHEATKYNPYSIDRLGLVDWGEQPPPFKSLEGGEVTCFAQQLPFLKKFLDKQPCPPLAPCKPEDFGTLPALAHLLYLTAGITGLLRTENGSVHYRANPSAGGLYPIELYFAVRGHEALADGLYYFHPLLCGAVPLYQGEDLWSRLSPLCEHAEVVEQSRLVLFLTGVFERSLWRYKERCYRRILLDAGCMAANAAIQAWAQGLSCRLLGGFQDSGLEELLDLTRGEVPLLALALDTRLPEESPALTHSASAPPCEAARRLRSGTYPGLFLQQNQVERIEGPFRVPSPEAPPTPTGTRLPLPPCALEEDAIKQALPGLGLQRRSCRQFRQAPISLEALGGLLQASYRQHQNHSLSGPLLQSGLVIHAVEGLEPGYYHYLPAEHALVLHRASPLREALYEISLGQALSQDCAALLVHTANLDAATAQYGDRAYRYLKMDAGALGENVNLLANLYHLGVSGIGAYFDDLCNHALGLAPSDAILYMTCIGQGGN